MNASKDPVVFFIVGPTCSGKTALSFYLSSKFGGIVINADSLQFYKYMDIGSAKPYEINPDHHFLLGHIEPPNVYTAGQFNKDARGILKKFVSRKRCFVVGGSGFYLKVLEKGCYPVSKLSSKMRESLVKEGREKGLFVLYRELQSRDAFYARRVHPHDSYRIIRALSVIRVENKKMSEVQKNFKPRLLPYKIFKIGLTASSVVLKKRIQMRTQNMIHRGLLREVEFLYKKVGDFFPPLQSVGYKEALQVIQGKIPRDELYERIVQRTLKLVKKQKTWFKKDPSIKWFDCEADFENIYLSCLSES